MRLVPGEELGAHVEYVNIDAITYVTEFLPDDTRMFLMGGSYISSGKKPDEIARAIAELDVR